jgi:hypothetical protein
MVKIKVEVFGVVKPCSVVAGYQRFGGPYCLHLHLTMASHPKELDLELFAETAIKANNLKHLYSKRLKYLA